jgi:hypothetical protein
MAVIRKKSYRIIDTPGRSPGPTLMQRGMHGHKRPALML